MFKSEQVHIDDSFILIESSTTLMETKNRLQQFHYVVVTVKKTHYTIMNSELDIFAAYTDSQPIGPFLEELRWIPSTVSVRSEVPESNADWRRPVLIQNDDRKAFAGILTAMEWIRYLQAKESKVTAYFHALAETVNDAVTAVDQEGKVICWNTTAEETYGIHREKILGRKIGEYFQDEDIVLHRILNEGFPVRQAYHRPDSNTHVLINASPIIQQNKIIGGVATEQDITRIVRLNEELYSSLPQHVHQEEPFSSIIGVNPELQQVLKMAQKATSADIPVLLTGESGSGKAMLAQAIHYGGSKKNHPFLTVNCLSIPPGLLETELFGYQRNSFTDEGQVGQAGKLEQANGGTLFIIDIDRMPLDIQVKLSNYLENQSFHRIGGNERVQAQTRIIASASPRIEELVQEGNFDKDLYYQLAVIKMDIPPLRDRLEDIVELVQKFMREFTVKYKKSIPTMDPEVMTALMNYHWPGNVRELRNVIERFILLNDGDLITLEQLPRGIVHTNQPVKSVGKAIYAKPQVNNAEESPKEESFAIEDALRKTYGNKSAAAKLLGISRGTLYNKIKEYGLD
ncbi:sigma 54-interacting transcriptional regulator [Bacillus sp. BRMEA1]|uniref:sigma-54 interaction domain-containing protein n=1 Tax=Neobacillus endophyticus TaxID=2738405 RepID=UPI001564C6FC|nr:sigma 54-interacting transcriptional regulator [Neobacillus endophyticus]NRD76836.1 sigma 54-interacting transcriptional regulator [Neobacillus endophyticus]